MHVAGLDPFNDKEDLVEECVYFCLTTVVHQATRSGQSNFGNRQRRHLTASRCENSDIGGWPVRTLIGSVQETPS